MKKITKIEKIKDWLLENKYNLIFPFVISGLVSLYLINIEYICLSISSICESWLELTFFLLLYLPTFFHLLFIKKFRTKLIFGFLDTMIKMILLLYSFFSMDYNLFYFIFILYPIFTYVGSVIILVLVAHYTRIFMSGIFGKNMEEIENE